MNRQPRRTARPRTHLPDQYGPESAPANVLQLCGEASRDQQRGLLDEAVQRYRRALSLKPDFAPALNNLACCYLAQGKLERAAKAFSELVLILPELLDSFPDVVKILCQVDPPLRAALARVSTAGRALPPALDLFGPPGLATIAHDPLLRHIIETVPVRSVDLERLLTVARSVVLHEARDAEPGQPDEAVLTFSCALARQCFINEYVFALTETERAQAREIGDAIETRLASGERIPAMWLAAFACYAPLHQIAISGLLDRRWPDAVDRLLTQQVREVAEEYADLAAIPRLTPIEATVSARVREQYEENPYPRWVLPPSFRPPTDINAFVGAECPGAAFDKLATAAPEMLVAGCGTGQQPIGLARLIRNVRVLAVDLSLRSLAHARRKTRELGIENIEYAQADILHLGGIGRTFDVIDAGGVLHHMADPLAAWQILLSLLRPGGLMKVSLYSELARRPVVAARAFIAQHGYRADADGIRRCRQEIVADAALEGLANVHDFYSLSECRDMLFHVEEHRLTIPQIKTFLDAERLRFLGFKLPSSVRAQYATRCPEDRTMTNLDSWTAFEDANPDTFGAMYQFWLQRS